MRKIQLENLPIIGAKYLLRPTQRAHNPSFPLKKKENGQTIF